MKLLTLHYYARFMYWRVILRAFLALAIAYQTAAINLCFQSLI